MTSRSKKKETREKARAILDQLIKDGRISIRYSVETVYSCIKKGDTVEIEDNRDKFKNLRKTPKSLPPGSGIDTAITNEFTPKH